MLEKRCTYCMHCIGGEYADEEDRILQNTAISVFSLTQPRDLMADVLLSCALLGHH